MSQSVDRGRIRCFQKTLESERKMKTCIELNKEIADRSDLQAKIAKLWPKVPILSGQEILPMGVEGLIVVGGESKRPRNSLLDIEYLDPAGMNTDQVVFQISGRLGKMLSSDILRNKITSRVNDKNVQLSRRDLLSGISSFGVFKSYSDTPVIEKSVCEAKFGCAKCLEVCPMKALSVQDGTLTLREDLCNRCGSCEPTCPVSAIQLPGFSDSEFLGLVYGIVRTNPTVQKTLVLTCNEDAVPNLPWTHVEEVKDVGMIGTRQLAIASSSGIDNVIVYCADTICAGKERAMRAVESIQNFVGNPTVEDGMIVVRFLEGKDASEEIEKIATTSTEKARMNFTPGRDVWDNYVHALEGLRSGEAACAGLGLTRLVVSESCTLCYVCSKFCPHAALSVSEGALQFESAKCTGCGHCANICPEHAITLNQLERFSELKQRTVFQDELVKCARCGRPIGSSGYLKRIATMMRKPGPMLNYCSDCKQHLAIEKMLGKDSFKTRSNKDVKN